MHFLVMPPFLHIRNYTELGILKFYREALLFWVRVSKRELEETRGTEGGVDGVGGGSVQSQFTRYYLSIKQTLINTIRGKKVTTRK